MAKIFGGGHKGDSSGRSGEESNQIVYDQIANQVRQQAGALGLNLSEQDLQNLINQLWPSQSRFADGGVVYDRDRGAALQGVTDLLPVAVSRLYQDKTQKDIQSQLDARANPALNNDHISTAKQIFNDVLGRDPNSRELNYYAREIARGADPYEVEQGLMVTPEYQKSQSDKQLAAQKQEAEAARQAVADQSLQYEEQAFKRAQPEIIAAYMKAGRLNSSGLDSAIARARAQINQERQQYLSGIQYEDAVRQQGYSREDYANRTAQAFSNYLRQSEPGYQQQIAASNARSNLNYGVPFQNVGRQTGLYDSYVQRQRELQDYNMQRNDYFDALDRQYRQQKDLLPYQIAGQAGSAGMQYLAMKKFGR